MSRIRIYLLAATLAASGFGFHGLAGATEYDCKPGVKEATLLRTSYRLPPVSLNQLRQEIEIWGDEQGLGAGGTGSFDPKTGVWEWSLILGRQNGGVIAILHFASNTDILQVEIENVCWEEQHDWQPLWKLVDGELRKRGYRQQLTTELKS